MIKKYLVSFIPFPRGVDSVSSWERHRETHEFETSACPGTYSFWYDVHCSFSGTTEKLEWVEI